MKPFLLWLVIAIVVFGALGGGYHAALTQHPRTVLVAVDSSFQMKSAWARVPDILDSLDNERYTQYALVTEKAEVHGWQPELQLGSMVPYAPLDVTNLAGPNRYAAIDQAARKYFITTDGSLQSNPEFRDWTIIQLTP